MYSFDKLLQLYYKTENSETFKNKYVDNLVHNINNNIVNDENFLLDFIIINIMN